MTCGRLLQKTSAWANQSHARRSLACLSFSMWDAPDGE